MPFRETLLLSFSHNLISGNSPVSMGLSDIMGRVKLERDLGSFGLFNVNSANFNTYFPEVTAADLDPKEEEFIQPIFRALSEVTVNPQYNPVDFSMDNTLKRSLPLLKGVTVNADHEVSIGNALGSVKDVVWQESYKLSNGIIVPAGINSQLKIDGKSHPRIARAIMMDPPAIHSTSVTVTFLWEKSHPNMSGDEFFGHLGTYDKDGKLIRRIASKIERYGEISLVHHGADPYAQKTDENNHIVNPKWADGLSVQKNGMEAPAKKLFFFDFKVDLTTESFQSTIPAATINNKFIQQQSTAMNQEFFLSLAAILGLTLGDDANPEDDTQRTLMQDSISNLVSLKNANAILIQDQKTKIAALQDISNKYDSEKASFERATALEGFKTGVTESLRKEVLRIYKLIKPTATEADAILNLIGTSSYETLSALKIQYDEQLEEKFPLTCKSCGGHEVNRASATQSSGDPDVTEKYVSSDFRETLVKKARSRNKSIPMFDPIPDEEE